MKITVQVTEKMVLEVVNGTMDIENNVLSKEYVAGMWRVLDEMMTFEEQADPHVFRNMDAGTFTDKMKRIVKQIIKEEHEIGTSSETYTEIIGRLV